MTVRKEREERKNERESCCNKSFLDKILKRTGKKNGEVADAFDGTTVNSFEGERPVSFEMVVRVLTKMFQDNGYYSRFYEIIPLTFYAILGKCNLQIVLTEKGTNIPVSRHLTIFSEDKDFDEKVIDEEVIDEEN